MKKEEEKESKKKKKEKKKNKQQKTEEGGATKAADPKPFAIVATPSPAVKLTNWSAKALDGVTLHPLLLRNIARQGFDTPTEIQRLTLPIAIGRNGKVG